MVTRAVQLRAGDAAVPVRAAEQPRPAGPGYGRWRSRTGWRNTDTPPLSVQRRMRSFGRSLTSRHSWSANQTGPLEPGETLRQLHQRRVRQHIGGGTAGRMISKPSIYSTRVAGACAAADMCSCTRHQHRRHDRPSCRSGGPSGRPSRRTPGPRRARTRPAPARCGCRPCSRSTSARTARRSIAAPGSRATRRPSRPAARSRPRSPRLRACRLFHCGAASPTPFSSNSVSAALRLVADPVRVGPEVPIGDAGRRASVWSGHASAFP